MRERIGHSPNGLNSVRVVCAGIARQRGTRVVRQLGAALTAGALSLFSGGIIGHALTISTTTLTSAINPSLRGQSVTFAATITPVAPAPTGTVTFQDAGINIAGCVNRPVAARVATCATATLAVGSHTVTAVYSGNATYATSTSAPVVQIVSMGSTATTVASSVNPSVSGQSVTYTATIIVVAPAAGARTGTVEFQDGGVDIAGCSARPVGGVGTATCAIAYVGPGTHTVTAVYSGDANFMGSSAGGLTQTINLGATALALTSSANPSGTGANVTFTATVTATAPAAGTRTGTVAFQVNGVNIAGCGTQIVPVSGKATCVTNALAVGASAISAIYSGNADFASSTSAPLTQTVNQGGTKTKVVSSLNPSNAGITVTFTATVTANAPASGTRTGTVAFQDGGITIAGCVLQPLAVAGTATCATSALAAGTHMITAVYSGDGNFTASTSPSLTQTVKSTTNTTVTSTVNPSVFGQTIQYTATIAGGPVVTGTVTFRDGGSNIAGCVALMVTAGTASCSVAPTVASHVITAVYSGDVSDAPSTSAGMIQVVTADTTTTVVTATANPTVFGQPVTFIATVTANAPGSGTPAGKVAFRNGAVIIGGCGAVALIAGVATCTTTTLSPGDHAITGVYVGSPSYTASTAVVVTETVNPGSTTISVGSSVAPSVTGQPVTYTSTVLVVAPGAGTPTGKVNFEDGGVTIAGCGAKPLTVAGTATCSFTYVSAGTHLISAIYSGDVDFVGSTSPNFTQNIDQASTSIAVASSVNPSLAGQAMTITATVTVAAPGTGTSTGTVLFEDGGVTITGCSAIAVSAAGIAPCATAFATVGMHSITATYSGDVNFSGSTSPSLGETVDQAATTTIVSSSVNPSVSGQPVSYTAVIAATAPASGTPTGTVTFMDGATAIGGCIAQAVIGGVAGCATVYAGVGAHAVTAAYGGDANFSGSSSPLLTQTTNQGATATNLSSSVNPSVSGEAVIFTVTVAAVAPATGTPSGSVLFLNGASTVAGCVAQPLVAGATSCDVTLAGVGIFALTAVYSGDVNFTGSSSPILTQTVSPAATATLVTSSVNPSVTGQLVTLSATVNVSAPGSGAPTGTVAFLDGGTTVAGCGAQPVMATGLATCASAFAAAGTATVTGVYSGDADFIGSTSAALTQVINRGATATTLVSSVNPSLSGERLTYNVSVTAVAPASGIPTGTVTYMDGALMIAGCNAQPLIAGIASCSVAYAGVGSHPIAAVYSADPNFDASISPVLTQDVNQAATSTSLISSVNPSLFGQSVIVTAAVSASAPGSGAPSGIIAFLDGGSAIAGCAAQPVDGSGTAVCATSFGTSRVHAVTAVYMGDSDFTGSTAAALMQSVTQGMTVAGVTSSVNPSEAGQGLSYNATVSAAAPASGTPTGTVVFLDGASTVTGCAAEPLIAGVASCNTTYEIPGARTITAIYSGDANFIGSISAALTQNVEAAASKTTLSSPALAWASGQAGIFTAAVSPVWPASLTPTGTATFMDAGAPIPGCAAQRVVEALLRAASCIRASAPTQSPRSTAAASLSSVQCRRPCSCPCTTIRPRPTLERPPRRRRRGHISSSWVALSWCSFWDACAFGARASTGTDTTDTAQSLLAGVSPVA